MNLKQGVRRSIIRSEKAYELYVDEKLYYQALRIYKANIIVYKMLQEFVFECEEIHLNKVHLYIFHLEDWFESFKILEGLQPALEDSFIFERLKGSSPFPSLFIKNVLSE